jgi:hypothetical protein
MATRRRLQCGAGTGILIGTGDLEMVRNARTPLPQVPERTREKRWRALEGDFRTEAFATAKPLTGLIVTRMIGVLECLEKLCKSLRPSLKRFVSKQDFFKKKLVLPAVPEIVLVQ